MHKDLYTFVGVLFALGESLVSATCLDEMWAGNKLYTNVFSSVVNK
jgi:hypothetical protein